MNRDRKSYLGSHDISAVLGLHPFRSEFSVWLAKRLGEPPPPASAWWRTSPAWYSAYGQAISEAAWWGQASERATVRAYWLSTGGVHTLRDIPDARPHPDNPRLASSPDALVDDDGCLECKEVNDWQWRETWDEGRAVPEWVRLQCLWHLACTGRDWCDISVRVVGRGGHLAPPIRIERDDEEINALVEHGTWWWARHIDGGAEPQIGAHDLAPLAARQAQLGPNPVPLAVSPHLRATLDELQRSQALLADLQADVDRLKAELVAPLVLAGATDAYLDGDGRPAWTYRASVTRRADLDALRKAHRLHNERTPRTRTAPPDLPEGITPAQLAAAVAVLDAYSAETPTARLHITRSTK